MLRRNTEHLMGRKAQRPSTMTSAVAPAYLCSFVSIVAEQQPDWSAGP
jgi:hypothetical protein